MDFVGIIRPKASILFEVGPGIAGKIIFAAGTVTTVTKDVTMGFGGLIVVLIINLGNLNTVVNG